MEILDALNWRNATKRFSDKKLNEDQVKVLLEAIRLSPTSYGLQAFKTVLVKNEKLREQIREVAYGQSQVTEASHLLILCSQTDIDETEVDSYKSLIMKEREMAAEDVDSFINTIKQTVNNLDSVTKQVWLSRQVYLSLGVLLSAAAVEGIDACPMEGFDKEKVDQILDLPAHGLNSLVLIPVGYRHPDDFYPKLKKVRKPLEEMVIYK